MNLFDLTDKEVGLIGQALSQLPYALVAPLISKIAEQLKKQDEVPSELPVNS